ncbi:hypothetical protein PC9H_003192 [Pleurotus ostreatus]|uniref:Uncharacterized protein n=1 Tax=Pleurotus ostreatus TaxID=5322 RepID=A0A8H7A0E8_PLEOS|nr:uncharacterized protein PC9H_003192 [Pleurotus ostreatus]KAF7436359.1 hypothetical protein PC9H_003192 [Pleurotus ostreatus]
MPSQINNFFICAASVVFAWGGFLLSVMAAVVNAGFVVLAPAAPPKEAQRPAARHRKSARPSPSRRSTAAESAASSESIQTPTSVFTDDQPLIASPSEIPGTSPAAQDYFVPKPKRKSLLKTLRRSSLSSVHSPDSGSSSDSSSAHSPDECAKAGMKRGRSKSMPRCKTPRLLVSECPPLPSSTPTSPTSTSPTPLLSRTATLLTPKALKPAKLKEMCLRKSASSQLPTLKVWPATPTLKQKFSQPLRTQPYEAPYFFPMPTVEPPSPPKSPKVLRSARRSTTAVAR